MHLVLGPLSVRAQLHRISRGLTPLSEAVTVALGDLKICAPGEGRLDLHTGHVAVDASPLVDILGDAVEDFHEIVAQGYSRVQFRGRAPQLLSRRDHVFTNSPTHTLVGGRAFAQHCVGVLDRELPSGHAPLEARFLLPRGAGRFKVPRWALQHLVYGEQLAEAAAAAILSADLRPEHALRKLDHVARAIVAEVRRCRIPAGPCAFAWQAHWSATARSCWARRNAVGLERAMSECPVHRSSGRCGRTSRTRHLLGRSGRFATPRPSHSCTIEIATATSDEERRTIRGRVARSLSAFGVRHRRIESIGVRDPDTGTVHSDPCVVGELLARQWASVFAPAPRPSRAALRPFLDVCVKLPLGEMVDPLSFEEFAEAIRHTKSSAPGPDGLPYEVWTLCGEAGARIIYDMYLQVVRGGELRRTSTSPSLFSSRSLLLEGGLRRATLSPTRAVSARSP